MNIGAAVLCGGKSSRMGGGNKAFIKINNIPLIENTINILKGLFDEIFLVTNDPDSFTPYKKDVCIITDIIKDIGPLGGIHSALSRTSKEAVFFVACDMPFLHNGVIAGFIRYFNKVHCDALIAKAGSCIEPLHAVYRKKLKDNIAMFVNPAPFHCEDMHRQNERGGVNPAPFHREGMLRQNEKGGEKKNGNYSIKSFIETVDACYWSVDESPFYRNVFKNLNTPDDMPETGRETNGNKIESLA
jgi:molybdopterin-guanine dinucleotide biosynthesis protein A